MEQNMQHIELFTKKGIFISEISIVYTKTIIKTIFKMCNIGYVDTVEFIPNEENEDIQSAIVYFENVILSDFSYQIADAILCDHSYNLHLEDDETWVLVKNNHPPSSDRSLMNEPFSTGTNMVIRQLEERINKQEKRIAEQNDIIDGLVETNDNLTNGLNYISDKFDIIVEKTKELQRTMLLEKKDK